VEAASGTCVGTAAPTINGVACAKLIAPAIMAPKSSFFIVRVLLSLSLLNLVCFSFRSLLQFVPALLCLAKSVLNSSTNFHKIHK